MLCAHSIRYVHRAAHVTITCILSVCWLRLSISCNQCSCCSDASYWHQCCRSFVRQVSSSPILHATLCSFHSISRLRGMLDKYWMFSTWTSYRSRFRPWPTLWEQWILKVVARLLGELWFWQRYFWAFITSFCSWKETFSWWLYWWWHCFNGLITKALVQWPVTTALATTRVILDSDLKCGLHFVPKLHFHMNLRIVIWVFGTLSLHACLL